MTQEEIFLAWCKEKKIKWIRTGRPGHTYELNSKHDAVLIIQGVKFELNKIQNSDSITVYFKEDGSWVGGTNMIWNTGLPWEPK